jgi:hypothetical protein
MSRLFHDDGSDHNHPLICDASDANQFRKGNGVGDIASRFASYGNFAGPENRMEMENEAEIRARIQADPKYDPYLDTRYMTDPRFAPKDAIDRAAMEHDHGYFKNLGSKTKPGGESSMFDWQGLNRVRDADRDIADRVMNVLDNDADHPLSDLTHTKGEGLHGFFGSRARALDAAHWTSDKLDDAGAGISNLASKLAKSESLADVGSGLAHGATDAGSWLAKSGDEALTGMGTAISDFAHIGMVGKLSSLAGYANVAGAGAAHVAAEAASDVTSAVGRAASGLWDYLIH